MAISADARPTKRFFIENLTRDLSLEDAILDLVDNSVDSFIRTRRIDVSPALLRTGVTKKFPRVKGHPLVSVLIKESEVIIQDFCGGIDLGHARHFVFRFGRVEGAYSGSLGVYGIGLKRAIFKIGREIEIESRTESSGFRVSIDVDQWAKNDEAWEFPLVRVPAAKDLASSGTTIRIGRLNPEVVLRINDGTLLRRLSESIASTYSLFLQRFLDVELNAKSIEAKPIPISTSDDLKPAVAHLKFDNVSAELIAGLAERIGNEWASERAGWYVLCNGRVVVVADKSELTGWGLSGPRFVSKHRAFLGIAFFFSKTPADLPWTTTKRGLNLESPVYQAARKEMSVLARPVLDFLNDMYPSEPAETIESRGMVEKLKKVDVGTVLAAASQSFSPRLSGAAERKRNTVSIQFDAQKADVDRIRKKLSRPTWSAGNVGRYAFEYFIKMECPK